MFILLIFFLELDTKAFRKFHKICRGLLWAPQISDDASATVFIHVWLEYLVHPPSAAAHRSGVGIAPEIIWANLLPFSSAAPAKASSLNAWQILLAWELLSGFLLREFFLSGQAENSTYGGTRERVFCRENPAGLRPLGTGFGHPDWTGPETLLRNCHFQQRRSSASTPCPSSTALKLFLRGAEKQRSISHLPEMDGMMAVNTLCDSWIFYNHLPRGVKNKNPNCRSIGVASKQEAFVPRRFVTAPVPLSKPGPVGGRLKWWSRSGCSWSQRAK